jgi:hypothetical protein
MAPKICLHENTAGIVREQVRLGCRDKLKAALLQVAKDALLNHQIPG